MKYTEKIHAKRLLRMLKREKPCGCCPKWSRYNLNHGTRNIKIADDDTCSICRNFVNAKNGECPCHYFNETEALKRTWESLEEKGYI
jgi:hypothetical protein